MILEWFGKSKEPESVADLVARRRYDRALEVLREHFEAGRRDIDLRIQYAEVLTLDQRAGEAVPILLGVVDELLAKGATERAQVILTQLEEMDPGNPEAAARWDTLATTVPASEASGSTDEEAGDAPAAGLSIGADTDVRDVPMGDADIERGDSGPTLLAPAEPPTETPPGDIPKPQSALAIERPAEEPTASDEAVVVDAIWYDSDGSGADVAELGEAERHTASPVEATSRFIPADDWDEDLASGGGEGMVDWVESLLGRLSSAGGAARPPGALLGALFEGIPRGEIRELAAGLRRRSFAAGEVALAEGAGGTSLFLLSEGQVRVSVRSPSGHHFPLVDLGRGDFFGEVAALSGRARCATVTAVAPAEALEIDRPTLDRLTRRNARAKAMLENACVERAQSPDAAAVRAVPADATAEHADRILEGFFGLRQASPRLRLRLASALLRAGNDRQVLPVLAELAEELAGAGQSRRALAILRRIEALAHRDIQELCLAPLEKEPPSPETLADDVGPAMPPPVLEGRSRRLPVFEDRFQSWLHHVTREPDQSNERDGWTPEAPP